jgi:hypothetical protein
MRGCLSILVLAVAFVVGATWFFGSSAAALVVETGLSLTGFHGTNTDVKVAADPPLQVLTGHADQIRITSDDATLSQFTAGHLDLTLTDVDLVPRRFAHADGDLTDVTMRTSDDSALRATTVEFSGDGDAAATTIKVDHDTLVGIALDTISRQLGVPASDVTVTPPNAISFTSGGSTIAGRLVAVDGGVSVNAELPGNPRIDLIKPMRGLRFTNVAIRDDSLVLSATLDVEALLR